jgi:hypothetical protein
MQGGRVDVFFFLFTCARGRSQPRALFPQGTGKRAPFTPLSSPFPSTNTGVSEDGQLGLDSGDDVFTPKVVEALLGTRFRGREFGRTPLVAGSRGSLAIDAEGRLLSWGWNARGTLGHGDW